MRFHPASLPKLALLASAATLIHPAIYAAAAVGDEPSSFSSSFSSSSSSSEMTTRLRAAASSPSSSRTLQTTTTVTYPPSSPLSAPLSNPERGLYWQDSYRASLALAGSTAERLSSSSLKSQRESTGMTLILRLYYLDSFLYSDISQEVLDDISADFQSMRDGGVKCILRFAYVDSNDDPGAVTEPAKPQLLAHIAQLAPILAGGEDVISVVQAGFLGPWGEWHSSTHFDDDLDGRKEVVAALLDAVPSSRAIQIRTPEHKKDLYSSFEYPDPVGGYIGDGGFENCNGAGSGSSCASWGSYMSGYQVDATEVRSGTNSVKVTDGGARQWISLSAPSGHTVRLSGYSKSVDAPASPGSSYSIYADVAMADGAGQTSYLWGQTAEFSGGTSTDWEYASHEFAVPEGKTVTGMTLYAMYRYQNQGYAYFDDVEVQTMGPATQTGGQVLDETTAHSGTDAARTGHHNDCFLASDTDYGTYPDDTQSEYPYLSAETKYSPMGGETCALNPPRSECPTALTELDLFHYTYLNSGYRTQVLQSWEADGCMDEIESRLGYRLALTDGTFPDAVAPDSVMPFRITFDNEGWAAPMNDKRVQLIFEEETTGQLCAATFPDSTSGGVDARTWYAGQSHSLEGEISLTATEVPDGRYRLHLHVTDPSAELRTKVEFKTLFANEGDDVNDPDTGLVNLDHSVDVGSVGAAQQQNLALTQAHQLEIFCGAEEDILPPAPVQTAVDPNTLTENGSFEGNDVPGAWSHYGAGYAVVSDQVHSGDQAVVVNDGAAKQKVMLNNAPAGSIIKISGYSKSSGVSTGLWNDYSLYSDVKYAHGAGYLWGQCARFDASDTENGWTYSEYEFVAAQDVERLTIYAMYRNDSAGGGTAWFDDVSVTVTPP